MRHYAGRLKVRTLNMATDLHWCIFHHVRHVIVGKLRYNIIRRKCVQRQTTVTAHLKVSSYCCLPLLRSIVAGSKQERHGRDFKQMRC